MDDVLLYGGAVLVRLLVHQFPLLTTAADGVLYSTPLTSWKRVLEGSHLLRLGIPPYYGDTVHEVPLLLWPLHYLISHVPSLIPLLFVVVDLSNAILLRLTAGAFINQQLRSEKRRRSEFHADSVKCGLLLNADQVRSIPRLVAICYLYSPYAVLPCVVQSTAAVHHLPLMLVLYASVTERWLLCMCALGCGCYMDVYPAALLAPLVAMFATTGTAKRRSWLLSVAVCGGVTAALLLTSAWLVGDWTFLRATYGLIFFVSDLTPNVGLFWYFFTEMFQHFEALFLVTFQINAFIYAIPLTLRFGEQPFLTVYALLVLTATFKSYPSVYDAAPYLALLPMWRHLSGYVRYAFVVGCFYAAASLLAPIMWHLWIHAGSANANFFFAVTLAYNSAQIFLITDILFAASKRSHELVHGKQLTLNGQPARLVLT